MSIEIPQTPGFDLRGKRALVVGASRGIGLAAAAALAQAGAEVFAAARSLEDLEELCHGLREHGHQAYAVEVDATDSEAIDTLFAAHGPFHIVVNSVGSNRLAPLVDVTNADLDAMLELNVKTAFYIARAAVRTMRAAGLPGSIVTISSQMGLVGNVDRSVYSATKHALEGMTKSLAWEAGIYGIRANTVCPTFIETSLSAPILARSGVRRWAESQTAFGRIGRIEEIMGPIVFLASDASSLVTGAALAVDAGWTAR
ncbi:SDR family oxidoreductase [Cryobacterium frigoriphilum]|uniref:SDR family oxidoreductase n=1 Tax=Cryobacterium frigoriphilum TaxID=1259150 RepID=A0A4R8ZV38_9MICO|nr:SDR family NAD(P)-dependent oxidoreductase [Cryobacterium frigoriphilum]TFD46909.1 SDR family oxidoreductase [Cryobacterium frigoriphilum]